MRLTHALRGLLTQTGNGCRQINVGASTICKRTYHEDYLNREKNPNYPTVLITGKILERISTSHGNYLCKSCMQKDMGYI